MIDTLKLSKRLQAAAMPAEQADALADGLADSLRQDYVSREFFDQRIEALRSDVDARLAALRVHVDGPFALLQWMLGFNLALTVAVLARLLFVH
ncbi:MAG: hypothetical protein JO288_06850 [Hyphomicrobiales bacterium]|nr:hypothetical protein [Hyphomicrobiales bacterium]